MRKSVDFPEPFTPMKPTFSPSSTANDTPSKRVREPKLLWRSCTLRTFAISLRRKGIDRAGESTPDPARGASPRGSGGNPGAVWRVPWQRQGSRCRRRAGRVVLAPAAGETRAGDGLGERRDEC